MITPVKRVPIRNPANALTVLRLILVPVFAAFVIISEMTDSWWRIAACVVFGVASVTDLADGWIARTWGLITAFGKVADPLADKALTGTALVLLSAYDVLPWWVTGLILARELGVTLMRFWVLRHGVIAASRGGKVKTLLQIAAIAWYLWPFSAGLATVGPWLMGAAVVVTMVTGLDYAFRAFALRRNTRT
ncbi:CDP-diacylglycerol--glycerol-3-phosphate 3-phosphatidyltransferase [Longispora sp. K20-0274]|uniref:CDP-diacylglycerol--glycerol-3-phosphate 3-phosphatidyltransferase n=1 Tax=Longispora sp. K20-0274 TaxID=3088255 RepID=UPI00399AC16B